MAIAPFLHAFVEIDEQFADLSLSWVLSVDLEQRVLKLRPFLRWLGDIALDQLARDGVPVAGEKPRKGVVERRSGPARLDRGAFGRTLRIVR